MTTKLSIITINRNDAAGLRKTIESVFSQTYRDFEYIVVDGASTDDSVDIIREYEQQNSLFSQVKNTVRTDCQWSSAEQNGVGSFTWISEPDTGIYNAMNKGLKMAHGEYTLMLNSGDYLVDEQVIERIIPQLDGTDIIQGNIIELQAGGKFRNRGYGRSEIDYADVFAGHILHQASFCRRDLFEKYGYFDESYKLAGDTKFFATCLGIYDASFRYMDVDIAYYDCSGISSAVSGPDYDMHVAEYNRLHREMFSKRLTTYILENERKIHLYDRLHEHKWIWYFTMALAKCYDWLYAEKKK